MDDDDSDEVMAPMVDALTGAMSAILLVTIFMMINTMSDVSKSVKEYGRQALYKNEQLLTDTFDFKAPVLEIKKQRMFFFKSFNLTAEQINELTLLFNHKTPKKFLLYSNDKEDIVTYNALLFFSQTGLSERLDDIEIIYFPEKDESANEFSWEF